MLTTFSGTVGGQVRQVLLYYYFYSLAALKALKAIKTTSPLVYQCQMALNDISTRQAVGLFWVPGHAGIRGNDIARRAREGWLCSEVPWT